MKLTLIGTGQQDNIEGQVDPTHSALRASIRPQEHFFLGTQGGHYSMVATWSNTAAKPAAASDVFSLRWTDRALNFALLSMRIAVVTTTTYTATLNQDLALYIARGFSVAPSGGTQVVPTSKAQAMRSSNMAQSGLSGSSGVAWVSSGDVLTTGTRVLDTQPIGYLAYQNPITTPNVPFLGTLWDIHETGKHPLYLTANEGLVIQTPIGNAQAAGISKYAVIMDWLETPNLS